MSLIFDQVERVSKIVVFFDICSSAALLEDLLRTENELRWRNLLIRLKRFLVKKQTETSFEIYKFLGDGWILLFDKDNITGVNLMELLKSVSIKYEQLFRQGIVEVLSGKNYSIGLTFGIDVGTLVKIVMNQRREYIGRALNVAARLQDAIKQKDQQPAGKLLISKNAFASLRLSNSERYSGKVVDRELRNIFGGEQYQARKIVIHGKSPNMGSSQLGKVPAAEP